MVKSKAWARFKANKLAIIGAIVIVLFILIAVIAPWVAPHDLYKTDLSKRLEGPSAQYPFGRDECGRDVFSRVIHGARVSLQVSVLVVGISSCLGIFIGLISGYYGGWVDDIFMRLTEILMAFPGILLALAIMGILGPGFNKVIIALSIVGWVGYARLSRAQVLAVREFDYVQAARALGAKDRRIIFFHILPAISSPLIVQATIGMAGVIIGEAGLSFLGFGVPPPEPSWGNMLNRGVEFMRTAPHLTAFPGLAIMIVVLALNFMGDGLRDALDPKQRT